MHCPKRPVQFPQIYLNPKKVILLVEIIWLQSNMGIILEFGNSINNRQKIQKLLIIHSTEKTQWTESEYEYRSVYIFLSDKILI